MSHYSFHFIKVAIKIHKYNNIRNLKCAFIASLEFLCLVLILHDMKPNVLHFGHDTYKFKPILDTYLQVKLHLHLVHVFLYHMNIRFIN